MVAVGRAGAVAMQVADGAAARWQRDPVGAVGTRAERFVDRLATARGGLGRWWGGMIGERSVPGFAWLYTWPWLEDDDAAAPRMPLHRRAPSRGAAVEPGGAPRVSRAAMAQPVPASWRDVDDSRREMTRRRRRPPSTSTWRSHPTLQGRHSSRQRSPRFRLYLR